MARRPNIRGGEEIPKVIKRYNKISASGAPLPIGDGRTYCNTDEIHLSFINNDFCINENETFLDLAGQGLVGPIPSNIEQLTNLQEIHLGSNQLSGDIPKEGVTNDTI